MAALTDKKSRIIHFLLQGLSHAQVASIVGCTPAYVGNLINADADFQAAYREAAAQLETKAGEQTQSEIEEEFVTNKYLALENSLLTQLQNQAASADFRELTVALKVVGDRQEKRADRLARIKHPHLTGQQNTNIAVLVLPGHAAAQFQQAPVQLNQQGEIIAVGDQSMAPMGAATVKSLFDQKRQAASEQAQLIQAEL